MFYLYWVGNVWKSLTRRGFGRDSLRRKVSWGDILFLISMEERKKVDLENISWNGTRVHLPYSWNTKNKFIWILKVQNEVKNVYMFFLMKRLDNLYDLWRNIIVRRNGTMLIVLFYWFFLKTDKNFDLIFIRFEVYW